LHETKDNSEITKDDDDLDLSDLDEEIDYSL